MKSTELGIEFSEAAQHLDKEVKEVYRLAVRPTEGGEFHGLTNTLYGYVMGVFARIDLVSLHWAGGRKKSQAKNQTMRLIGFMDEFFKTPHEANSVAVQCWRNKLMHTSKPQHLPNPDRQLSYRWLLHWWEYLPKEQHFTFTETSDSRILNLGLVYLIDDLRKAIERYLAVLSEDSEMIQRFREAEKELASEKFELIDEWRPRNETDIV